MPYIHKSQRFPLDARHRAPLTVGELNYAVTCLINDWLRERVGYAEINEAIGVLECAKLELYRRIAAPYEDKKIAENGDVYDAR